jgi:hypothetical protein
MAAAGRRFLVNGEVNLSGKLGKAISLWGFQQRRLPRRWLGL